MPGKHDGRPGLGHKGKRIVTIVLICALVLGAAGGGGFYFLKHRSGSIVNVYPVNMLGYQDYYRNRVETEGPVTADRMQSVYLTSTQTVTEIYVEEGQQINVGDPILAFDTTLDEVELEKKQIEIDQLKLDLSDAQAKLKEIGTYRIGTPGYYSPPEPERPSLVPVAVPYFQGGSGTAADPYVFLWDETLTLFDAMIDYLIAVARGEDAEMPAVPDAPDVPTTATPAPTDTPEPSPTPSATPEATEEPGASEEPEATPGDTPEPTDTPEATEEPETTPSDTPAPTDTPEATKEPAPVDPVPDPENTDSADGAALTPVMRAIARPGRMLRAEGEEPEPTAEPVPGGDGSIYIVFESRESNALNGYVTGAFELAFRQLWGGVDAAGEPVTSWIFRLLPAAYSPLVEDSGDDGGVSWGGFSGQVYTAEEINQMKTETQQQIADTTLSLRMAEQELKALEFELSNGEVLCTTAGVVKTVMDPTEALEQNQPVVLVSGGGGYYITGVLGEFDMDVLHVGDTVTVQDWMSGTTLDAEVTEISPYPVDESNNYYYYWSPNGNENVSKYPFTVRVGEDAGLREGYYVSISFSTGGAPAEDDEEAANTMYLERAFVRTEGARSYVYVANGERLEKRYVTTGSGDGWSVEITGGLDMENDYLAFPYGRAVKDGAKVAYQEDLQTLAGGYY